jgi:hypothetical protein
MRYIFLDSNIFFNNWPLQTAELLLLADFLQNSHSSLLISKVVSEEVQNLYERERIKTSDDLKKISENAYKHFGIFIDISIQPHHTYYFEEVLKEKMKFIEWIDYSKIPNSLLVQRAIKKILPFRENEKGFRDTLIWLSLIEHLKGKSKEDEIIFINRNVNDFYEKDSVRFHEDLRNDLVEANNLCNIKTYKSLNDFISELKNYDYQFSKEKINDEYVVEIERQLENILGSYLNNLPTAKFKSLIEGTDKFLPYLHLAIAHEIIIHEGIEDGEVIEYKKITANSLYVRYHFNLRICDIQLTIPETDYLNNKQFFDKYSYFTYGDEIGVNLTNVSRPDFIVNFIYNIDEKEISGFELLFIKFLK